MDIKEDSNIPLWSMVAENPSKRTRYHIATESFISFCGRTNLLVRDYIEFRNEKFCLIGEGKSKQIIEVMKEDEMCKVCMLAWKNH